MDFENNVFETLQTQIQHLKQNIQTENENCKESQIKL
jgi:hypothetical protein